MTDGSIRLGCQSLVSVSDSGSLWRVVWPRRIESDEKQRRSAAGAKETNEAHSALQERGLVVAIACCCEDVNVSMTNERCECEVPVAEMSN